LEVGKLLDAHVLVVIRDDEVILRRRTRRRRRRGHAKASCEERMERAITGE
jgi:hypothetical protein